MKAIILNSCRENAGFELSELPQSTAATGQVLVRISSTKIVFASIQ